MSLGPKVKATKKANKNRNGWIPLLIIGSAISLP
jgi:hypothetical protein